MAGIEGLGWLAFIGSVVCGAAVHRWWLVLLITAAIAGIAVGVGYGITSRALFPAAALPSTLAFAVLKYEIYAFVAWGIFALVRRRRRRQEAQRRAEFEQIELRAAIRRQADLEDFQRSQRQRGQPSP